MIGLLLFVGLFVLYMAVTRAEYYAYDAQAMMAVTRNLVDHGTLKTTGEFVNSFGFATPYAPYGIAVSILEVPLYALSKLVGHAGLLEALLNPLLTAAAATLLFHVGRTLSWSRVHSLMAALGYGVFSMAIWYTTELFSEPGVALCVVATVLGAVKWRQEWRWAPLVTGFAAACAIQLKL